MPKMPPAALQGTLSRAYAAFQMGRAAEAEAIFRQVLASDKKQFDSLHMLGLIEAQRGDFAAALPLMTEAVRVNPNAVDTLVNLGRVQFQLGDHARAVASYEKALRLNPNHALAHANFSAILRHQGRFEDALRHCDAALRIEGRFADAWNNRGNVLYDLGRSDEALASYERALALNPNLSSAATQRLHIQMQFCDWRDFERQRDNLIKAVRGGAADVVPFPFLAISETPEDQSQCARVFVAQNYPTPVKPFWNGERYSHDRIRVGYLSADFRNHPVAHLMVGIIEQHDRSRFEPIAFSIGVDDSSQVLSRFRAGFERFIDVRAKSDVEVARLMREQEIDIAVDLMGHTSGCRPLILAMRPAPIQVNYLGFSGTLGAKHIDYVIADRIVIPEAQRPLYVEQVAYLPDSFMVNDAKREIAEHIPARTELGLPETGFVFCSFNNSYKITPRIFDIWMRLLSEVPGSVLWLSGTRETTVANLRREAEARGVQADRLIFSPRVARNEDHLARHRRADLFLDTLPFNAHSTAADALYAGLPVLTCLGQAFAGRAAASLATAAGLPELVTANLADYEALALKLARDPALLAEKKAKLAANQKTGGLFDTARFTRNIEAAYRTMWDTCQRGEPPRGFSVETNR